MSNKRIRNFYLAGGTALALQIGHRFSDDFDLFTDVEFGIDVITDLNYEFEVISRHPNSIEIFIDNTKVFFFYFGFELIKPTIEIESTVMADPIDIGLMKLLALQGRSSKKDIIDLYYIHKQVIQLDSLLDLFEDHYAKDSFNSYSSLKKLLDFEQIKNQPDPIVLAPDYDWEECKSTVSKYIVEHINNLIGNESD